MQFKEFDWLSCHGIWAIIPCPTNMVSVRVSTTEKQWRPKKIVSWSKRGFCEIKRGKTLAKFGGCWLSIISYPTCPRGIIVNYCIDNQFCLHSKVGGHSWKSFHSLSFSETEINQRGFKFNKKLFFTCPLMMITEVWWMSISLWECWIT